MSAVPMASAVAAVVSKPTAVPMMMFVAGPVREASAISWTGRQAAGRVVLRDVDEGDAGEDADDAAAEEPVPGVAQQDLGGDDQADDGQDRDDVVAVVQRRHRVLVRRPPS